MKTTNTDPHLQLAVETGLLSQGEVEWFNKVREERTNGKAVDLTPKEEEEYNSIKIKRNTAKAINFHKIYSGNLP